MRINSNGTWTPWESLGKEHIPIRNVGGGLGEYTLVLEDDGGFLNVDIGAAPSRVIVPDNNSVPFPIGTHIKLRQASSFQYSIEGETGVNLLYAGGSNKSNLTNSVSELVKIDTNTWSLYGDLTNSFG